MHIAILASLTLLCAVGLYAVIHELKGAYRVGAQWAADEQAGAE